MNPGHYSNSTIARCTSTSSSQTGTQLAFLTSAHILFNVIWRLFLRNLETSVCILEQCGIRSWHPFFVHWIHPLVQLRLVCPFCPHIQQKSKLESSVVVAICTIAASCSGFSLNFSIHHIGICCWYASPVYFPLDVSETIWTQLRPANICLWIQIFLAVVTIMLTHLHCSLQYQIPPCS